MKSVARPALPIRSLACRARHLHRASSHVRPLLAPLTLARPLLLAPRPLPSSSPQPRLAPRLPRRPPRQRRPPQRRQRLLRRPGPARRRRAGSRRCFEGRRRPAVGRAGRRSQARRRRRAALALARRRRSRGSAQAVALAGRARRERRRAERRRRRVGQARCAAGPGGTRARWRRRQGRRGGRAGAAKGRRARLQAEWSARGRDQVRLLPSPPSLFLPLGVVLMPALLAATAPSTASCSSTPSRPRRASLCATGGCTSSRARSKSVRRSPLSPRPRRSETTCMLI